MCIPALTPRCSLALQTLLGYVMRTSRLFFLEGGSLLVNAMNVVTHMLVGKLCMKHCV